MYYEIGKILGLPIDLICKSQYLCFLYRSRKEYSRRIKEYSHRACVDNLASVTGVWSHMLRKMEEFLMKRNIGTLKGYRA